MLGGGKACRPRSRHYRRAAAAGSLAHRRQRLVLDAVEIAAAGDEQAFNANAVGILKQARVIAGRPRTLLAGANDLGAEVAHRNVQRIDVLSRAQTEAEVVQADAPLIERHVAMLGRGRADEYACPAANAVE